MALTKFIITHGENRNYGKIFNEIKHVLQFIVQNPTLSKIFVYLENFYEIFMKWKIFWSQKIFSYLLCYTGHFQNFFCLIVKFWWKFSWKPKFLWLMCHILQVEILLVDKGFVCWIKNDRIIDLILLNQCYFLLIKLLIYELLNRWAKNEIK